jgi:hypothetical protein
MPTSARNRTGRHAQNFCPDANLKNLKMASKIKNNQNHGGKRIGSGKREYVSYLFREEIIAARCPACGHHATKGN